MQQARKGIATMQLIIMVLVAVLFIFLLVIANNLGCAVGGGFLC